MDFSNFLPQTLSPTSYQIAQYGRCPVSYFFGLPQISIPLTEVRGRGYTLPIFLQYHGGGIKPEQHPGWVGLGWSLSAGGCITRVIHGMKDEMSKEEYSSLHSVLEDDDPGYIYNMSDIQSGGTWTETQLYEHMSVGSHDYEPDEYIINAPGISARFVIVGEHEIRVISRDESVLTLEKYEIINDGYSALLNLYPGQGNDRLTAYRYKYIREFVLRDKEGNRYIFGGSDDSIEYSVIQYPNIEQMAGGGYINTRNWKAIATANSWMLSRIERADGEVLDFSYEHNGVPIVLRDIHYGSHYSTDDPNQSGLQTELERILFSYDTYSPSPLAYKGNLNFSFLMPCYLTRIRCLLSGDTLDFETENTTELGYEYQPSDFTIYVADLTEAEPAVRFSYQQFQQNNFYRKLVRITGKSRDIRLDYTNSTQTRLKLNGIRIIQNNVGNNDTLVDGRYSFEYNSTPLPGYNSRKTDFWGYYNGQDYSSYLGSFGQYPSQVRQPSASHMAAEILVAVHYPTGGWTDYEWEPHHYGMTAFPPTCSPTMASEAIAGGLRIKSITDHSDGTHYSTRSFTYQNSNGTSSGILSAWNKDKVEGSHTVNTPQLNYDAHFVMYSETPILPLSDTDGCHVTYSQVRETFADGGYLEFRYTNSDDGVHPDTPPYREIGCSSGCPIYPRITSYANYRGLLLWKKTFDSNGALVRSEQMTYGDVGPAYYASAAMDKYCGGLIVILSYSRERCGYPALISRSVSERAYNGMGLGDYYQYTYNDLRLMTSETRSRGNSIDSTRYFYPSDRSGHTFEEMISDGFLGVPISAVKIRDNMVIDAREMTYKSVAIPCQSENGSPQTRDTWLLSKVFSGKFSAPVSLQVYLASPLNYLQDIPDVDIKTFDETAFPCYTVNKDGSAVELYRSSGHGVTAMSILSPEKVIHDVTYNSILRPSLVPSVIVQKSFQTNDSSTSFSCSFAPNSGFAVHFEIVLDGETYNIAIWAVGSAPDSHWMSLINNYPSTLLLSIPAGSHTLLIRSVEINTSGGNSQSTSCGSLYLTHYQLGQINLSAKFIDLDIENETGEGFHCAKGHVGPLTVSHTVQAGRQYILDYMEKTGDNGSWIYKRVTYTGGNVTIGGSGKTVSCVRIYPTDTMPELYSYEDYAGVSAKIDARGISEAYGYDALGRLEKVYDNSNCITTQYAYNHATAGEVPAPNIYDNEVRTSVFTSPVGNTERLSVLHMDGLGRPVQEVLASGGNGVDIVSNKEYDNVGRKKREWIPLPVPYGTGRTSGDLSSESVLRTAAGNLYPGDSYLYSEWEYETSPRDKVIAITGPGQAWATANKKVSYLLYMNSAQTGELSHRGFTVLQNASGWFLRRNPSATTDGQLAVIKTESEDSECSYEFRNFRDEVVMVRRGNNNDTHYVYDTLGRLAAVLPPKLVSNLESSGRSEWTWSEISDLAFLYRYDSRGNCIAKNIPGAGWTYMVYDKGGRCVFTQDEVQRQTGQWTFSLQDILGRQCVTGTVVRTMDVFTDPVSNVNIYVSTPSSPSYVDTLKGYTLSGISSIGSDVDILTVHYYDGYGFLGSGVFPLPNDPKVAYDSNPGTGYGSRYAVSETGMLTGHLSKVLESGTGSLYLWSVMYYDDKGRVVQKRSSTHLGGVEKDYFGYDFTGALTAKRTVHCKADSSSLEECFTYTYDNMGRPLITKHKIGANAERLVLSKTYDLTGRLLTTGRLSLTSATQTHSYNIRSWLTGISGPRFTEVLDYYSGADPRFDGKISRVSWKSGTETSLRKYELSYDNLARLVSADYSESSIPQAFDETYEYDANGNMNHILRKGLNSAGTAVTTIKNISMALTGNRMTAIGGSACSHDDKGRMTSCAYGEAWTATYNILDLPQSETVGTKSISRKYSADGIKLQEKITDGGNVATRDYVGNCIYENGVLKKILFEGGYTEMNGNIPSYRFFLIDHLGSVRAVIDEIGSTCQINQYYPFGDLITDPRLAAGSQDNCYRFTGKERSTETLLHDFGARYLDTSVGRFTTIDPLAEKYPSVSPYAYCCNNPVQFVDVTGCFPLKPRGFLNYYLVARALETSTGNNRVRELGYAMQHPIIAFRVGDAVDGGTKNLSSIASNFATNIYNVTKGVNDNDSIKNAIRHVLWQSMLTQHFGVEHATRIGNSHEGSIEVDLNKTSYDNFNEADRVVDLLNNIIGRYIGATNPKMSNQDLAKMVVEEFFENGLWTYEETDDGKYLIHKTVIDLEQKNQALDEISKKNQYGLNR